MQVLSVEDMPSHSNGYVQNTWLSQWFKVDEKKPNDGEKVLAVVGNKNFSEKFLTLTTYNEKSNPQFLYDGLLGFYVTHWCRLPNMPEECKE